MGVINVNSSYTVGSSDDGAIIVANAAAGAFDVTLPASPAVGFTISVHRKDYGSPSSLRVIGASGQRIGFDGPSLNITGVTNNGSGLIRIGVPAQRFLVDGMWCVVAATVSANGEWSILRVPNSFNAVDLVGSTFTAADGGGGTITAIRKEVPLRTAGSYIKLLWDGSRWLVLNGSLDTLNLVDVLIGNNKGYDGIMGNVAARMPLDFMYDSYFHRLWLRSVILAEMNDPPETIYRRSTGDYPDGTRGQVPDGTVLGFEHYTGDTGDASLPFYMRSAHTYTRAVGAISLTNGGGRYIISTTPTNTVTGPLDALEVDENQRVNIGYPMRVAKLNIVSDTENIGLLGYARKPDFSGQVLRFVTTRAASSAFDYIRCSSSNDTNIGFRVDGLGCVFSDGGTAMSTPADYAEMIREWWDDNRDNEDRAGKSVVMVRRDDPDKIILPGDRGHKDAYLRLADSFPWWKRVPSRAVIGVVSVNPAVKGAAAWGEWIGKYKRDSFGRYEYEEVEVVYWDEIKSLGTSKDGQPLSDRVAHAYVIGEGEPDVIPGHAKRQKIKRRVLSPDYDPSLSDGYVAREDRPEWSFVGLLGRLPLFDDQPVGANWIMLGEIGDGLKEWLIR